MKGLHWGGSAQALVAAFPTCWDVEVLTLGANDAEPGDVFARYVWLVDLEGCGVVLRHEDADLSWTLFVGHALSIRLPYTDGTQMSLGFMGSYQDAPVSAAKNLPLYLCIFTDSGPRSSTWGRT